jgi:thioredoxin-dependent peroxiredoxin
VSAPTLSVGDMAPDFTAPLDDGSMLTLSRLRGRPVVLFFYPKDGTPG